MAESSGSLAGVVPRPLMALPAPRYSKAPSGTFDIAGGKKENRLVEKEETYETKNEKWDCSTLANMDHGNGSSRMQSLPGLFDPRQDLNYAHYQSQAPGPLPYQYQQTYQPAEPVQHPYMQGAHQQHWSSDTADYE